MVRGQRTEDGGQRAEFVARMQELLGDRQEIQEIPRAQRYPGRPTLARLFGDVARNEKSRRNQRICTAHIRHGYTLKEIADYLGIHYTTVSRALRAGAQDAGRKAQG